MVRRVEQIHRYRARNRARRRTGNLRRYCPTVCPMASLPIALCASMHPLHNTPKLCSPQTTPPVPAGHSLAAQSLSIYLPSSSMQGGLPTLRRADHSELRQIPDNQEVLLSASSDTSIVIEILALVEEGAAGTDLWEAAK